MAIPGFDIASHQVSKQLPFGKQCMDVHDGGKKLIQYHAYTVGTVNKNSLYKGLWASLHDIQNFLSNLLRTIQVVSACVLRAEASEGLVVIINK